MALTRSKSRETQRPHTLKHQNKPKPSIRRQHRIRTKATTRSKTLHAADTDSDKPSSPASAAPLQQTLPQNSTDFDDQNPPLALIQLPKSPELESEAGSNVMPLVVFSAPIAETDTNPPQPLLNAYQDSTFTRMRKKKRPLNLRHSSYMEKLESLQTHLKPLRFAPKKDLDFAKHEGLLRTLGLWDFIHLDFDENVVRRDLLEQLIANYCPLATWSHSSWVNGNFIKLSRRNIALALKLPSKRYRFKGLEILECGSELVSDEEVLFVEDLVLNWLVLHDGSCVLPDEVLKCTQLIKERKLEMVDWANLIWVMVEKELLKGKELVECYYASHLMCLLKYQKPAWFDVERFEEEGIVGGRETEGEKDENFELKIGGLRALQVLEIENRMVDVGLGQSDSENGVLKMESLVINECSASLEDLKEDGNAVDENHVKNDDIDLFEMEMSENHRNGWVLGQSKAEVDGKVEGLIQSPIFFEDDCDKEYIDVEDNADDMKCGHFHGQGCENQNVALPLEGGKLKNDVKLMFPVQESEKQLGFQRKSGDELKLEVWLKGCKDSNSVKISKSDPSCVIILEDEENGSILLQNENEDELKVKALDKYEEMNNSGDCIGDMLENRQIDTSTEHVVIDFKNWKYSLRLAPDENSENMFKSDPSCVISLEDEEAGSIVLQSEPENELKVEDLDKEEKMNNSGDCSGDKVENRQIDMSTEHVENAKVAFSLAPDENRMEHKVERLVKEDENVINMEMCGSFGCKKFLDISNVNGNEVFVEPFVSEPCIPVELGESSAFDNSLKREIDQLNEGYYEFLNEPQKRIKCSDSGDEKSFLDVNYCMEKVQLWVTKSKRKYARREQAWKNVEMNQSMLIDKLQHKDESIQQLKKSIRQELQKKDREIYCLEQEVRVMENILAAYKKALKESRRTFAKYRELCQLPDEPFYIDIKGSGGIVLSLNDLEEQHVKREHENKVCCFKIEETIKTFQQAWMSKLEVHLMNVDILSERLLNVENGHKLLKEKFLNPAR